MKRLILPIIALGFLSTPAFAHPDPAEAEPEKSHTEISDIKLPTKAEMQKVIDQMPDFNGIMGDLKSFAEDEELKDTMADIGSAFAEKLDESGAFDKTDNGLPDINKMMEVMMFAFTEEDIAGELVDTRSDVQDIMEKHIPEDMVKKIK